MFLILRSIPEGSVSKDALPGSASARHLPVAQELEELDALAQPAPHHLRVVLGGKPDGFFDRLLGLAGEAEDEGTVDRDAELVAVLGEAAGDVDPHALLDVVEDLLVAGLVADEQEAQPVVAQNLERRARHVRLGVAGPGDAEPAEFAGDRLGARPVVGERVVVEEELLDLRKIAPGQADFLDHMGDAAVPVAVPADGLRPQAEGAFRAAAAPGVERQIGVLQIADEIILDLEIAPVDLGHERQLVHILEHRPGPVVGDRPTAIAIAQPVDIGESAALGDLLDREVEFLAGDEINRARRGQAGFRLDRDLGADEADREPRVGILQGLGNLDIAGEGRGRGMQHRELVIAGERQHIGEAQPRRRGVDQLAAGDQRRRLGEPGRVPERADLPLCLIARPRPAVEPVERWRVEKQGLHHTGLSPSTLIWPLASTRNNWSRQNTLRPKKLLRNTAKDKASRNGSSHSPVRGRSSARAVTTADIQRSSNEIPTHPQADAPDPPTAAARAVTITVWVITEPAKPAGAIAREVRAQRSSCRHKQAKDRSVTRFSTMYGESTLASPSPRTAAPSRWSSASSLRRRAKPPSRSSTSRRSAIVAPKQPPPMSS